MKYNVPSRRSKPEKVGWLLFSAPRDVVTVLYVVSQVMTITVRSATMSEIRLR